MAGGSADVLKRLRAAMRSSKYVSEPLTAYIIPTDDAHQVSKTQPPTDRHLYMAQFMYYVTHVQYMYVQ